MNKSSVNLVGSVLSIVAPLFLAGCRDSYFLTRSSAKTAIEQSVEFRHKTKFYFEVGDRKVFDWPAGTDQLRMDGFLSLENGHMCQGEKDPQNNPRGCIDVVPTPKGKPLFAKYESARQLKHAGGAYEMAIGSPNVIVTGIVREGINAKVEFTWNFVQPNEIGRDIQEHNGIKLRGPFEGTAHMVKYDSGWRISDLDLDKSWIFAPSYPAYPDPLFEW
jgi:hypothetical protein